MWIHDIHCRPLPMGPPAKALKGGSIFGRAPPSGPSTIPVRISATRAPSASAFRAASSHAAHVAARNPAPGGLSSSRVSSP